MPVLKLACLEHLLYKLWKSRADAAFSEQCYATMPFYDMEKMFFLEDEPKPCKWFHLCLALMKVKCSTVEF